MKILFDATSMLVNKTGVAYYTERMMTELAKLYPEHEFVGFYYNFLGRKDSSHLPRHKNLHYTNASIIPSKVVFQLRRWGVEFPIELLALQRADFILYPNFISYPSIFRTPDAPVIHDLTYLDLPEYVSGKLRRDLIRFVPRDIERAKFVITVSDFSKRRLIAEYKIDPAKVIVTPIPPAPPVIYDEQRSHSVLSELGIQKPYILFVGTIEPRKNIPNLIDGFLRLPGDIRERYQLVIAGRIGWNCDHEIEKLEEVTKKKLPVLHLGYVTDETREILYQNASLFTSASHYEGFGMPVLEAMSYGIPSCISDIPVFHEVASNSAEYFDQSNPESIGDVLSNVLSSPEKLKQMGGRAKKRAASFSWETVARQLFERILAEVKN